MDFFAFLEAHLVEYPRKSLALPSDFLGCTLFLCIVTSGVHHHMHIDTVCICFGNQELCRLHHEGHNLPCLQNLCDCLLPELRQTSTHADLHVTTGQLSETIAVLTYSPAYSNYVHTFQVITLSQCTIFAKRELHQNPKTLNRLSLTMNNSSSLTVES